MGNGTELGKVRGLGSAREGAHHWLHQRITALANVALVTWFVVSLARLDLSNHGAVIEWVRTPMVAFALVLLVISVFWHLKMGLQVLIEDYVHGHGTRIAALVALAFFAVGGGAFALFTLARIFFAGAAA